MLRERALLQAQNVLRYDGNTGIERIKREELTMINRCCSNRLLLFLCTMSTTSLQRWWDLSLPHFLFSFVMRRITFKHLEFSLWREIFPSKVNEVCLLEYPSLVKKVFLASSQRGREGSLSAALGFSLRTWGIRLSRAAMYARLLAWSIWAGQKKEEEEWKMTPPTSPPLFLQRNIVHASWKCFPSKN